MTLRTAATMQRAYRLRGVMLLNSGDEHDSSSSGSSNDEGGQRVAGRVREKARGHKAQRAGCDAGKGQAAHGCGAGHDEQEHGGVHGEVKRGGAHL